VNPESRCSFLYTIIRSPIDEDALRD
jgi:hypothetical protein